MKKPNIEFNMQDDNKKSIKISDSEFVDFLVNKPLYNKILAVSNCYSISSGSFSSPNDYVNKVFDFKCPAEKGVKTFKTELPEGYVFYQSISSQIDSRNKLPDFFNERTRHLDLSIHLIGKCQSCGQKIDFMLKAFSDKSWDEINHKSGINIYITKTGQLPSYSIAPEKIMDKYLLEEDIENYKKALICFSISYGIGAYAYLRRIVENEIIRLITDISNLEFDGSKDVRTGLKNYKSDHHMSNLINIVTKYLPKSLTELGDNPIKLLHEQLSVGIHKLNEGQCLERAEMLNVVLKYVIKKINEEK